MQILRASDKPALIYKDEHYNFTELLQRILYFSSISSLNAGDRCIIFSENRPEWIISYYSCWNSQAIPVPLDAASSTEEIVYILQDCRPTAVFCSEASSEKIREALAEVDFSVKVLIFEEIVFSSASIDCSRTEIPEPADDATAVIVYTSGTTGSPKGVMLSFENLWANLHSVSVEVPIYRSDDRVLVLLPLHHVLPLQGTMVMPLTINACVVLAPSLQAADILATLKEHKITIFLGVPRLFTLLRDGILSKIRQKKLAAGLFYISKKLNSLKFSRLLFSSVQKMFGGSIRYMPCGGAALDHEVVRDFRALGFEILLGYGLSETAPMVSFTHPGKGRKDAAGQIIPCNEVKIVDGEIAVRGKNVMQGYYKRAEETAEVLRDGWFYTGDLGHLDEENYIYITGRKKETIVLPSGKNINPEEVEEKLLKFPDFISEAAVLASGDALQAIILPNIKELHRRSVVNLEEAIRSEVLSKYNKNASAYKRIFKCTLISESLPRTRLGKLKRHELEELANKAVRKKSSESVEPDLEEYRVIKEFLYGQTGLKVFPDDHFELDLSLDSLGKISFQVFLSGTFGLDVDEQTLLDFPTPEKLALYINGLAKSVSAGKQFKWGELLREKVSVKLPKSWFTFHWFNRFSAIFLRMFCKLKVENVDNIPEGACILAPNHQSYLDVLFIIAFLKKKVLKDTYFYAKADHVKYFWQRFMANRHNVIVMDINKELKLSLQKLASVLKNDKKVIIFPEGTRSIDGKLGDFKQTFAILGQELNVPIVPVAIDGAYDVLPRHKFFPRPFRKVNITFLEPIMPEKDDSYSSLSDKVYQAVAEKLQ